MEDFNSDERFLVPDSEEEDLNSREPWDLISGLQALASQKSQAHFQSDFGARKSQAMSSPHKKEKRVFPAFDSSESAEESKAKNVALAYDTISSDIDSGESSHNQTVIERVLTKKTGNTTSTPSETIGNLQFSQDVILVPETLDSLDVVGPSPKDNTAPFIVPDSPSQDDDETQEDAGMGVKVLSSSSNSQFSSKIDSQGLHLHFSQSQLDSSETPGSLEQADAMFGDRGLVTTPVKDPTLSLSCRKLSLKDVPPSPQRNQSLPKSTFHLPLSPAKQHLASTNDNDDAIEGQAEGVAVLVEEESKRVKRKLPRKQRLFMDTEEEVGSKEPEGAKVMEQGQRSKGDEEGCLGANENITAGEQQSQPQSVASLVLTEEPESVVMDVDQTISYEYNQPHDRSLDGKSKESVEGRVDNGNVENVTRAGKSKDESQSQPEFDGFDDEDVETIDHNLQSMEKANQVQNNRDTREDSPEAPSSQVRLPETIEATDREAKATKLATSEISTIAESLNPDPYLFQGSQSQNVADVSNQPPTDKSRSVEKPGATKTKVVKVMRKVLKKKMPAKEDQKSSSTDESISTRSSRSRDVRPKVSSAPKSKSKLASKKQGESSKASLDGQRDSQSLADSFTAIQSRLSNVPATSVTSQTATSDMPPPPVARNDVSRKSAMASTETSPLEINKLSKKAITVSFQEESMPKAAKELPEHLGEVERKTVREFRAIVIEKETTIDILDDKGNILKQTVTKEVTRTPIEPPWLSVSVQRTERILSPNVSPSRSASTLTSGDLADVSSSSLSRSMSSGSKGSNPSLEFCSQSYPTPAQRSLPLELDNNKAGSSGAKTTKSSVVPSVLTKQDSKRSSSGSNTGQDLFGSPDMSGIPHCSGNNLDKPVTGFDFPKNLTSETILSRKPQIMESDRINKHFNNDKQKIASRTLEENINESEEMVEHLDDEARNDAPSRTTLVKNVQQSLDKDAAAMPSKGRGKRKIETKMANVGKRLRRDNDESQEEDYDVAVEASGSSVSTGFIVQDAVPSGHTNDDKATSRSEEENDRQTDGEELMHPHVDDPVVLEIKSRLLLGEKVMGKWTDGYYYPGVLKKMDSVNMRYQLKFDDGSQRWVGPEGLLLAKELPIGQSVMVLTEDEYYLCGMIIAHTWAAADDDDSSKGQKEKAGKETQEKTLMYQVERDDGVSQKCTRKDLLLSEDQAACLTSDHNLMLPHDILAATTPKKGDISLDNLVEGKRQHRAKGEKVSAGDSATSSKKSAKAAGAGDETPSGAIRSGRKRKMGPVATSTPTPKQTTTTGPHYSGTPLKPSTTDRLGGVMSSPSVSRKSPRKTRQVLFGKKLAPPADLFKGCAFLLTHIDKSVEQRLEEKHLLGDSSLEDTSLDDNGDQGPSEEPHPFMKEQLQSLISAGGGKVLDKMDMELIQETGISQCYLVACEHQRTVKYLQALAANVKIVSHQWILHSIDQGRLLSLKAFLLPAGISLEKRKLMECKNVCSHLRGRTVLIVSSRDDFVEAWSSILSLAKCHLPARFPARAVKADPGIDYVVSDTTCPAAIIRKCRNLEVPLVSSEWVAQCLINNALVDPTSHNKYRHDCDS